GITLRKWLPRRRDILRRLTAAVGGFPRRKVPLRPRTIRKTDRGDYAIEALYFHTRPNWPVSALLYLPKKADFPVPGVLMVHGHAFTQKASPVYQKVAVHLVKNGYAVLAVDFVGGGDRLVQDHGVRYLFAAGKTVMGIMVWDNMRAIDYLSSRKEVNAKKIGITGSSGGGNQSAFTTVFDQRIAASAPVNAVTMYKEHMGIGCDYYCPCEVIPGMWGIAEYSDLMATVAPRPLLLVQAIKDRLFPIAGTRDLYYRAREVYKAFDVPGNIEVAEDYGPHSYSEAARIAVIRWFDRHLKGVEPKPFEDYQDYITVEDERSEVLVAFPGGRLPKGSDTLAGLYAGLAEKLPKINRPRSKRGYATYRRKVRAHLSRLYGKVEKCAFDVEKFPEVGASWGAFKPFAFRSERGITIPSVFIEPLEGPPQSLVIHTNPKGKAGTVALRAVEDLVKGGAAVLALDLRATGETEGRVPHETSEPYGFVLNRSIALGRHISMMRAFDITRAVELIRSMGQYRRSPVHLWAEGHTSMAALFAFALDTRIRRLAASDLLLTYKSRTGFKQDDAVLPPGILVGADVADVIASTLKREMLLVRPQTPAGGPARDKFAREALSPAFEAAKILGASGPTIAIGSFEPTNRRILEFLLK
ncbi:MAG: alpha/beta hydrolase family protein, partial [Planctomycetota bacterium]